MSMPTTSLSFSTLSSSQNRAFQYICQIMSKMDSIPNDYVDQEIGDIEQYSVSQTIVEHNKHSLIIEDTISYPIIFLNYSYGLHSFCVSFIERGH